MSGVAVSIALDSGLLGSERLVRSGLSALDCFGIARVVDEFAALSAVLLVSFGIAD
jgi:hypothetical protein